MTEAWTRFQRRAEFLWEDQVSELGTRKHRLVLRTPILALHLRQIALLALVALGDAFHEFQELAEGFAFGRLQTVEFEANSKAGIAAGNDPIEDQTLNPDFPIGHPQSDFELYSSF